MRLSTLAAISAIIQVITAAAIPRSSSKEHSSKAQLLPASYGTEKVVPDQSIQKRDYATTLQYLRAAMASYRKDAVTPPSAEFVQMEQSLAAAPAVAPAVAPEAAPAVAPVPEIPDAAALTVEEPPLPQWANPSTPVPEPVLEPAPAPSESEQAAPPDEPAPAPENTEAQAPATADIEEDDTFDSEEDPDDVDDPPIVNGVPVDREE